MSRGLILNPRTGKPETPEYEHDPARGRIPAHIVELLDKAEQKWGPENSRQYFADTLVDPPTAALPTITATTETVLVPTIFTPIAAMEPRVGKVYQMRVGGTVTTGTAGTLTITPRYGLVIGGVALGASGAQNYVPSITLAPFYFEYTLVFRSIGVAAGANSTCVGSGQWISGGAVATAASSTVVMAAATASVSVDTTVASGLWIGVTFSVAPSVIPHWATWQSFN